MHPPKDDQENQALGHGEAVEIKVDPIMEFTAPILKRSHEKSLDKIDLTEIERLASLGMKPAAIGPCIGLTVGAFRYRFEKHEQVRDAYAKGNAAWTKKMLERTNAILAMPESARNPSLLIFALKQGHGAGWADEVEKTPEAVENRAQLAWDKRKAELKTVEPPKLVEDAKTSVGGETVRRVVNAGGGHEHS